MKISYKSLLAAQLLLINSMYCMENNSNSNQEDKSTESNKKNEKSTNGNKLTKEQEKYIQGLKKYALELRSQHEEEKKIVTNETNNVNVPVINQTNLLTLSQLQAIFFQQFLYQQQIQNQAISMPTTNTQNNSEQSVTKKTVELKEICKTCGRGFATAQDRDAHRKISHPEEYLRCSKCNFPFRKQKRLLAHKCKGENSVNLPSLAGIFISQDRYLKEKLTKPDLFQFRCQKCNHPYKKERACSQHQAICTGKLLDQDTTSSSNKRELKSDRNEPNKKITPSNAEEIIDISNKKRKSNVAIPEINTVNIPNKKIKLSNTEENTGVNHFVWYINSFNKQASESENNTKNNIEIEEDINDNDLKEFLENEKIDDGSCITEAQELLKLIQETQKSQPEEEITNDQNMEELENAESLQLLEEAINAAIEYHKAINQLKEKQKINTQKTTSLKSPYVLRSQIDLSTKTLDLDDCAEAARQIEQEIKELTAEIKLLYQNVIKPLHDKLSKNL